MSWKKKKQQSKFNSDNKMSMQQLKGVAPHLQMLKWRLLNTSSGCCNSKLISKPELHKDNAPLMPTGCVWYCSLTSIK